MPPKQDPPSIEASMAAMVETVTKLVTTSAANTDKIISTQATAQSQLDIIMKQLSAQYEQTNALLATLIKPYSKPSASSILPKHEFKPSTADSQPRPPKLTFATFDGSNPLDWLFQADQYFSFYKIHPSKCLTMVAFYLSGDALSWYKYLFNNKLLTTWDAFTRALETRFGPSMYDNHQAALFKLRQSTTVTAYQTEFERLSNCIIGLPHDALLNCFLSGLCTDINQELSVLRPTTITQAIGLAKLIKDKNGDSRSRNRYSITFRPPSSSHTTAPTSAAPVTSATPTGLLPTPTKLNTMLPFNRLSPEAL